MRVFDANWMQIEEYLSRDDRIVLPTGSTEQHGYLSLGTDAILAERVAAEAAGPLGVPVLPVLPFGMAPYFAAFPGSMSLRITTYIEVLRDLLDGLAGQGFRRIAIINGHGGNSPVTGFIREWICQPRPERVQVLFHSWYNAPQTAAAASQFDPDQMHGGWVENFPWTRVAGAEMPRLAAGHTPGAFRPARRRAGPGRGAGWRPGRRLRAPGRGHEGRLGRGGGRGPGATAERLGQMTTDPATMTLTGKTAV